MENAKYTIMVLLIISISSVGFARFGSTITVNAHTGPSLEYFYWINATNDTILTEEHFQKYLISWENIGSVSCKTRAGIYLFKANETENLSAFSSIYNIEYIAWSKYYESNAGSILTIELNSPLPEGKYFAKVRVYYCNELVEFGPYNVIVNKRAKFDNSTIRVNNIDFFDNYIELKITADKNIDKIHTYPLSYPFGWIIEQNTTDMVEAGKEKTIRIGYERPAKQDLAVKLRLASNDSITDTEIMIKEKELDIRYVIIPILIGIFVVGLYGLYKLKGKKRR